MYHIGCGIVGGAETQVLYLANSLPEGVTPLITYEYPQIEPFIFKRFNTKHYYRIFSPNHFAKKLAEWKPDIIQFYHCPTIYNYLGKVPIGDAKVIEVAHNRTSFPGDSSTYGKDRTDVLVCVSQSAKDHYISKCGENVPMIIIPNGINTDIFLPPQTPRAPKPILTGGYCGRFEAGNGKGVEMLINLASKLPINFELVGYDFGNHRDRLRHVKNIKFFQHTNNITAFYHRWDFFVSCSPAEGFGLAIAEALACGLPCVILDCGGICNYLEHKKHAYIAKDEADVITGIKTIIDGERYEPLSIDFSAKKMTTQYMNLYEELIKTRKTSYTVLEPPPIDNEYTLGIVPFDWYGIKQSLLSKCNSMCEPQSLIKELRRMTPPTQVIFGGFMESWLDDLRILRKLTNAYITITYHGTPLIGDYDDICRNGLIAAITAMKDGLADCISTPHEGLARTLNMLYKVKAVYEPNKVELVTRPKVEKLPGFHIGIFGTGMPWKNVNTQILGAAMTPGLSLTHLQNLQRPELMTQLKIPFKVHPYYKNREEFHKLAAQMTINLAVSTTEAFGYFPLESVMLGVPVIVGATTPSFRSADGYAKKCIVNYIDDPAAVSDAIIDVMDYYDEVLIDSMRMVRKLL